MKNTQRRRPPQAPPTLPDPVDARHRTIGEIITEWSKGLGLILDYLKVTRRTVMAVYGYFLYETSHWFFELDDPTTQQVTYVTAILGLAGIIFGFYSNSPSDYIKLDNAKRRQYGNRRHNNTSSYSSNDDNNFGHGADDGFWEDTEN